jgi:hypothetical protein
MATLQLSADECSHCFNLRRKARENLIAQDVSEEQIEQRLADLLCIEHRAIHEDLEQQTHRRPR